MTDTELLLDKLMVWRADCDRQIGLLHAKVEAYLKISAELERMVSKEHKKADEERERHDR